MTLIPASSGELTIGPMTHSDWPTVGRIYANGIATGNATFETETPEWGAWDRGHLLDCRQVARGDNTVVAWAALSPVSARACYSQESPSTASTWMKTAVDRVSGKPCCANSSGGPVNRDSGPCRAAFFRKMHPASRSNWRADFACWAGAKRLRCSMGSGGIP